MGVGRDSNISEVAVEYFFLSINSSRSNSSVFKCLLSSAAFCGLFCTGF